MWNVTDIMSTNLYRSYLSTLVLNLPFLQLRKQKIWSPIEL